MNKRQVVRMTLLLFPMIVFMAIMVTQDRFSYAWSETDKAGGQSRGGDFALRSVLTFSDASEKSDATISPRHPLTGGVYKLRAPVRDSFDPVLAPTSNQPVTRTYSVNTGAFLLDTDETDIVMSTDFALVWAANSNDEAGFYMSRPADWDGVSPVQVRITFALGGNGAGTVN